MPKSRSRITLACAAKGLQTGGTIPAKVLGNCGIRNLRLRRPKEFMFIMRNFQGADDLG